MIVVFGGSFNPITNAHLAIAQEVINNIDNVSKIIFVPVGDKYPKKTLISANHRLNMLYLAVVKNNLFEISENEVKASRRLYTIETLDYIKGLYPNEEIALLIGADKIHEIPRWKEAHRLMDDYKIILMNRNGIDLNHFLDKPEYNKENFIVFNTINIDISSTIIRDYVKQGKNIQYLTDGDVISYIKKNNLYK